MRSPIRSALAGLALTALALTGCTAASSSPAPSGTPAPVQNPSASPTAAGPAATPGPNAVRIYYEDAAQFEIVTPGGPVVFIDVWDSSKLVNKPTANDFLLTTHGHPDHLAPDFEEAFPGQKLTSKAGSLQGGDVKIQGIPAQHDEGQDLAEEGGSDYIYVIDVAGMRLAHFGDLGQDKLTDDQLAKLGKVDIAFSQLANTFSTMDETNKKGFNQMNQVSPRLLVVTHLSNAVIELAPTIWQTAWATGPIMVSKESLPARLTCLFMGAQAESYGKLYKIPPFGN